MKRPNNPMETYRVNVSRQLPLKLIGGVNGIELCIERGTRAVSVVFHSKPDPTTRVLARP